MSERNCKTIRSRIEESALGDEYPRNVGDHLTQCESCRQFEDEQRNLRELVGCLGTIEAPADFDFKLRARMSERYSSQGSALRWFFNPIFATAAAIVLFVGVIAGISYVNQHPTDTVAGDVPPANPVRPATPVRNEAPAPRTDDSGVNPKDILTASASADTQKGRNSKRTSGSGLAVVNRQKRSIVSSDFSSTGAEAFRAATQLNSANVFPIDASLNSLKVSVDDGRGNARTISLPGVSFGSQRVLASGNQFAQKGVW